MQGKGRRGGLRGFRLSGAYPQKRGGQGKFMGEEKRASLIVEGERKTKGKG